MESSKGPSEPGPSKAPNDPHPNYWGLMIQQDKTPSDQFDRLLRGIAFCISTKIERTDNYDLTPGQMAAFYRSVGGNYDALFTSVPHQSISLIYRSLGCLHSLQPVSGEDKYAYPSVPALKPSGFVTWQTIQMLLGPAEHVPMIQNALQKFNVIDPVTNEPFPKYIPAEVFPPRPDEAMLKWHDNVSEQLRKEAIDAAARARAADSARRRRPSSPDEEDYSADDEGRTHAARHFANPLYKNKEGRPGVLRTVTKHAPPVVRQGGAIVANTVSNIISPFLWSGNNNKKGPSDRAQYDDDLNLRPSNSQRPYTSGGYNNGYGSHGRGTPRRPSPKGPSQGPISPSSDDDPERFAEYRKYSRRHRSQEPPSSRLSPDSLDDRNSGRRSRSSSYNNVPHRNNNGGGRQPPDLNVYSPNSPPLNPKVSFGQQPEYFPPQGAPGGRDQRRPDMRNRTPSYPNIDASMPRHRPSFPSDNEGRRSSAYAGSAADPRSPGQPQPLARQSSLRHASSQERPSANIDAVDGVGGRRYAHEVPWR